MGCLQHGDHHVTVGFHGAALGLGRAPNSDARNLHFFWDSWWELFMGRWSFWKMMIVWSLNPNSDGFIMNSGCKIAMIILQFGFVSIWGTLMDSQKIPWCVMIFPMKNPGFCCLSWFHEIADLAKVTVYSWFLDIPTWSQKAIAINILSPLGRSGAIFWRNMKNRMTSLNLSAAFMTQADSGFLGIQLARPCSWFHPAECPGFSQFGEFKNS